MNALNTSPKHAAARAALVLLVIGASPMGFGAANERFAPVCTGS